MGTRRSSPSPSPRPRVPASLCPRVPGPISVSVRGTTARIGRRVIREVSQFHERERSGLRPSSKCCSHRRSERVSSRARVWPRCDRSLARFVPHRYRSRPQRIFRRRTPEASYNRPPPVRFASRMASARGSPLARSPLVCSTAESSSSYDAEHTRAHAEKISTMVSRTSDNSANGTVSGSDRKWSPDGSSSRTAPRESIHEDDRQKETPIQSSRGLPCSLDCPLNPRSRTTASSDPSPPCRAHS